MSGKPEDNTKKNIAYTITAGYYPELASSIKFGGRRTGGKGPMGAKYVEKRGFSASSLRRIPYEASDRDARGRFKKKGKPGTGYSQEYEFDEFFYRDTAGRRRRGSAFIQRPQNQWQKFGSMLGLTEKKVVDGKSVGGNPQQISAMGFGQGIPQTWDDLSQEVQSTEDELQKISYTKWMGGTELHKLYGTKVWYQEGIRSNRKGLADTLKTWGNAIKEGETGALPDQFLTNIYSRSEPKLVEMASAFAEQLFEGALDEANLEQNLESIGAGRSDVPEEDVLEAQKAGVPVRMSSQGDVQIDKASRAQKLDILTKDAQGRDVFLDSTEVAMTEDEGHGIVDLGGEAMKAVKDAIVELGPDGDIQGLKHLVKDFFINNINTEYNPAISKMKQMVLDHNDDMDENSTMTFKDILNSVDKQRKKFDKEIGDAYKISDAAGKEARKAAGTYRSKWKSDLPKDDSSRLTSNDLTRYMSYSVQNVAAGMHRQLKTGLTKKGQDETISRETMKYVVHMLASLGDSKARQFRQGHRLFTYPDNTKVYASVPMSVYAKGARSLLFKTAGPGTPERTLILRGDSHLLALATHWGTVSAAETGQIHKRQTQARSTSLITSGHTSMSHKTMKFESDGRLRMEARPATVVVFNPKSLDAMFEKIMGVFNGRQWKGKGGHGEGGLSDEQIAWEGKAKDLLDKQVFGWPKKPFRKNKAKGSIKAGSQRLSKISSLEGNRFWALPYLGINDNIYRGGKEGMQK